MFRVLPRFPDGVSLHGDLGVQVKLEIIGGVTGGPGGLTSPLHLAVSGPAIMGLGGAQRGLIEKRSFCVRTYYAIAVTNGHGL